MPPRQTAPSTPSSARQIPAERPAASATSPAPSMSAPPLNGAKLINIDPKPETTGNPTDGIDLNIPLETSITPRLEPIVQGTTRPYIVNGETILPMSAITTPFIQTGHASWYGKKFHGRKTASGEIYDMYKLTAAHRTLPIPSYARVTNLSNGKTLLVRVNDRGPFGRDRVMDLSYAAAKQLDIIRQGLAKVEIALIDPSQVNAAAPLPSSQTNTKETATPAMGTLTVTRQLNTLAVNGIYVQVGAFGQEENADRLQQRIFSIMPETQSLVNKVYNGKVFQIVLGPFQDHALAVQAASQMRDQLQLPALIFSR
ncbi:septal ring lytic transglycosylase RlpA family protein [Methylophilus aquaticus]|uniref:Endolytic peptidoglycan transglycosylase RlpA n=1 Tax=Methylophilus aquaticus TaxID=1971610 RepID=A0ABT9JP21_9PROT|nr:septal ring lytic transglycosylase RlpA family protein [Methylophilus aquaticus]MDP8566331.1 septal ring lytic transglycosylase RlpA family protein [Methylophilus aquaticus]